MSRQRALLRSSLLRSSLLRSSLLRSSLLRSSLLTLLTVALTVSGAVASPTTADVPGHITGTVLDPSGEPLAYVGVNLFAWDEDDESWQDVDGTQTDGDGAYDLAGLADGTYRVGFHDYSGNAYLDQYWDEASNLDEADDITIEAGGTVSGVGARLIDGGHVRGTLTGPAGQAAPSVTVVAYRYLADDDGWEWTASAVSASDGTYDVGGLVTGTYRLQFSDDSHGDYVGEYWNDATTLDSATSFSVTAGQTVTGKNAELAAGGRIGGTVTAPNGQPASDVTIAAYRYVARDGYWQAISWASTAPDGTYAVGGLPTGTYRIGFSDYWGHGYAGEYWNDAWTLESGTDIPVTAGQTTGGKDAQLAAGSTITGTVTGPDSQPVANVQVDLYRYDSASSAWRNAGSAETDGSGHYSAESLAAGTYRLRFTDYSGHHYLREFWNDARSLATATDVAVGAGQVVAGKDARLAAGGQITGTVTAPGGAAAGDIRVFAYGFDAQEQYWDSVASATTDSTGSYTLVGLEPGTYRVGFRDDTGSGYLTEYWNDALTVEAATDVVVASGQTVVGKDALLAAGGHITGTVNGPDDTPAEGVGVDAYRYVPGTDSWRWVSDAETGADGTYDVGRLPTGTYRIGFYDYSDAGSLDEYWDDAPDLETATDIAVTAGQTTTGKNARLAAGGHIAGTVTGPGGQPATEVDIAAYQFVDGYWEDVAYTTTDGDGGYDLGGLPSGTYRIQFRDYSGHGYATEYWNDATTVEAANDITVIAGQTTSGKNAQLAAGGHITGTVTGPGGQGLDDIGVSAYLFAGGEWSYVGWAPTGPDGTYDLGRLRTGTYRIGFDDYSGSGYASEYWNDASTLDAATDIAVTAGQTVSGRNARLAAESSPVITNAAPPTIVGTPQVGSTLSVVDGSWSPADGLSMTYQWFVGGDPVAGANGLVYTPTSGDVGRSVTVAVTASRPGYTGATALSAPTAAVTAPPAPSAPPAATPPAPAAPAAPAVTAKKKPTLAGAVRKNATLTLSTGTWNPSSAKVAIQWYAGDKAIKKATTTKLRLTGRTAKAVVGRTISVRLTVTAPGYTTATTTLTAKGKLKKPKR